jgi:ABC-type amino acid transport substrate-binding protein
MKWMLKTLWRVTLTIILLVSSSVSAQSIKSSVSPEFPDGLHSQYLSYLAKKLEMELILYPMPFARRLEALKDGDIDIMVGLKFGYEESDEFIYLEPKYETLCNSYFVLANNKQILSSAEQLQDIVVGLTIDKGPAFEKAKFNFKDVIPVSSLSQKILMLDKGRIDSFVHFEASAKYMIKRLGLQGRIVLAPYQTGTLRHYHYAIGKNSWLLEHKDSIETIIRQGVIAGDFELMREKHYDQTLTLDD